MQHHKTMLFRAMGGILISAVAVFGFIIAKPAFADVDPPGCTATGGSIILTTYRADGTTAVGGGTVADGELIKYKATLGALASPTVCAYEFGTWTLTTPDAVVHDITPVGGVPRIGGTGVASLDSALVSYTVIHGNEISSTVTASTLYSTGKSHKDGSDTLAGPTLGTSDQTIVIHIPTVTTNVHNIAHGVILASPIGSSVHDNAVVAGTNGTPAGTVDFNVYANTACEGVATTQAGVALVGGLAESSSTNVPNTGMSYKAHYNGQAGVYTAADGACEPLTATKLTSITTTDVHNAAHGVILAAAPSDVIHDKATVSGSGPTPTGTVDFTFFNSSTCLGEGSPSGTAVALVAGIADPSGTQGPLAPGTYSFKAHYNGDANYNTSDGACEPVTIAKASPTIGTTPVPASGPIGTVLNDTATLSGGSAPTGSVTFKLFPPADATCAGAAVYTDVDASAPYATSPGYVSLVSGTYRWTADYAGDVNNNAVSSGCQAEQVTINKLTPTVVTDIHDATEATVLSVNAGTTVHDKATVTGSGAQPTGSADFTWYTNGTCSAGAVASGAGIALVAGIAHPSTSQTPVSAGNYSFKAHYNGDETYNAADGACEPLEVKAVNIGWCSHGYWKQSQHFDNWVNYSPNQLFSSVFENAFPGKTLLQVLQLGGGGLNALGRDTVGELLNAGKLANPGQTQAQVISMFNAVFPGTNAQYDALHAQFVFPENCGLN